MTFDLNFAISSITAIAAIAAPVITTKINNKHIENMSNAEYRRNVMTKAIKDYISAASNYISDRRSEHQAEYAKSFGIAMLFVDDALCEKMKYMDIKLCNFVPQDRVGLTSHLYEISNLLNKMLSENDVTKI